MAKAKPKNPSGRVHWSKRVVDRFCERLIMNGGNVSLTTREMGLNPVTFYKMLQTPLGYKKIDDYLKEQYEIAKERSTTVLIDEAIRRAHSGVDEPVYFQGVVAGHIRRYSDTLLKFLIEGQDPNYSKKMQLQHTGAVQFTVKYEEEIEETNKDSESDEEIDA